mmetsp:Transcript_35879/g.53469  ORF Transcript_35879/g.53469 Transcript_35879/m.53469 type:complete len:117 (-) Transcript_35879:41-391(-)
MESYPTSGVHSVHSRHSADAAYDDDSSLQAHFGESSYSPFLLQLPKTQFRYPPNDGRLCLFRTSVFSSGSIVWANFSLAVNQDQAMDALWPDATSRHVPRTLSASSPRSTGNRSFS